MKDYSFGNYICALRTGLGLSQFQLGTLVGVSDKAVSKWENGDAKPRIGTCHRLAAVLGVSINELLSCEQEIAIPARKELEKMNSTLWKEAYHRLSIYGEQLPAVCVSRLAAEEAALCGTDAIQSFALMGQLQGAARKKNTILLATGTVNSSFAAWLFGGTHVNPLPAHYRCPNCGSTVFVPDAQDGFDLPQKHCACGAAYIRDGHNLPFQGYAKTEQSRTYLELRVSPGFIPHAIAALYAFYEGIAEILPVRVSSDGAQFERYIILPENKPKPPVAEDGFWHCSFEAYWQWQSGETTYLFIPSKWLDVLEEQANSTGIALPDPLTLMTPQMFHDLCQLRCQQLPHISGLAPAEGSCSFDQLVRLDALGHATFVPTQEELLRVIPLEEIPACRENIYNTVSAALSRNGIRDDGFALLVMERARKGLYHSQGIPDEHRRLFASLALPQWYPDYLENTRYLFPKGHCIAHLLIDALKLWYSHNERKSR